MLFGTLHGHQVRGRGVANVLAKTRRRTQKGEQKLQSHRIDIGDVEVVRVMCYHNTCGWIVSVLLEEVSRSE